MINSCSQLDLPRMTSVWRMLPSRLHGSLIWVSSYQWNSFVACGYPCKLFVVTKTCLPKRSLLSNGGSTVDCVTSRMCLPMRCLANDHIPSQYYKARFIASSHSGRRVGRHSQKVGSTHNRQVYFTEVQVRKTRYILLPVLPSFISRSILFVQYQTLAVAILSCLL
jgi:hypothetical protein